MEISICTTVYNNAPRLRASLKSIIDNLRGIDFEMVVVDNWSTDGTWEILKNTELENMILIRERCSRGRGRQIAFENSSGKYIVPVDLDVVYYPVWRKFIDAYLSWEHRDRYAVLAWYTGIYPRALLERVGGWRDLQMAEDWDLAWRLIEIGALKWYPLVTGENWAIKEPERRFSKNFIMLLARKLRNEIDLFRVRGDYSLYTRLLVVREWTSTWKFYLFWSPLVVAARLISELAGRRKLDPFEVMRKWKECLIDFNLEGELRYRMEYLPASLLREKQKIPQNRSEVNHSF